MNDKTLLEVCAFAAKKHEFQRRKCAENPAYINHPIEVATLIQNVGKVNIKEILAAALLHDTVEDTDTTFDEIEENFGSLVRNIVEEVTDDKNLSKVERKKLQLQNAPKKSYGAKLVKLGDMLHNLSSLINNSPPSWSVERIQGYFTWKYFIVREMRGTNANLEDKIIKLFLSETFTKDGKEYPTLKTYNIEELEVELERYYMLLDN